MILAELKKLACNSAFRVFLGLFLLAGIVLPMVNGPQKPLTECYQAYSGMDNTEVLAQIEQQRMGLDIQRYFQEAASLPPEMAELFLNGLVQKYDLTSEELAQLAQEQKEQSFFPRDVLEDVEKQVKRGMDYPDYLGAIQSREQDIQNSILYRNNAYALALARKTARAYAPLAGLTLSFSDPTGVETILGTWVDDAICCAIVCLTALFSFSQERVEGMTPLLFSAKRGCQATFAAKISVVVLSGAASCLLLAVVRSIMAGSVGDLSRPIQTIPGFYASPYRLSVEAGIVLSLVQRIAATIFVGLVMSVLCIVLEQNLALAAAALLTGLEIRCWQGIHSPVLQPLKYISIPALFSDETLLGNQVYVKLLGVPVNNLAVSLTILLAGGIGLVVAGSQGYAHSLRPLSFSVPRVRYRRRKRIPNLFWQELNKLLIHQKAILLLLLVIFLQPGFYHFFRNPITTEEAHYLAAMKSVEGAYSQETRQALLQQKQDLEQSLAQTGDPFLAEELRDRLTALDRVIVQADYLAAQAENGSFVYETGFDALTGERRIGIRYQPVLIGVTLCLMIPGLFTLEKESGMDILVSTTAGKVRLRRTRLSITLLLSLVVGLICWFPETLYIFKTFMLNLWTAPAVSLQMFAGLPGWIPIWLAVSAVWTGRILAALLAGIIIAAISSRSKWYLSAVLSSGIALELIGLILQLMGHPR